MTTYIDSTIYTNAIDVAKAVQRHNSDYYDYDEFRLLHWTISIVKGIGEGEKVVKFSRRMMKVETVEDELEFRMIRENCGDYVSEEMFNQNNYLDDED